MPDPLPPLPDGFFVEAVPHDQAIAWLRGKPAVSSAVFNRLLPELKARAIAVSGIESAKVVRGIREAIAAVPAGADWDKQKRLLAETLHPYLADPAEPKNKQAARTRAELLLRTHGFQAYAVASHEVMRGQQSIFPWWQYLTMGDELVRHTHSALNGLIIPASSPFWLRHSPPWDWGCRCRKVPLLDDEAAERRESERTALPEKKTVLEGESLRFLETQQKLDRGPSKVIDMTPPAERGRAGAFLFEPDSLTLMPEMLKGRHDDATWSEFSVWAKTTEIEGQGRSVWAWMEGQRLAARFSLQAGTGASKTVTERLAENAELLTKLPRRKHPMSAIFTSDGQTERSLGRRKAVLLAEAAHEDGKLPPCSMIDWDVGAGDCADYGNNLIRVHPYADQPILSTLHEMGHHMAAHVIKPPAVSAIAKVAEASTTAQKLLSRTQDAGYWLSPEELFCRSYAQWVARRTRDPELAAELAVVLKNPLLSLYQWPDEEFNAISQAVEKAFRKVSFL